MNMSSPNLFLRSALNSDLEIWSNLLHGIEYLNVMKLVIFGMIYYVSTKYTYNIIKRRLSDQYV